MSDVIFGLPCPIVIHAFYGALLAPNGERVARYDSFGLLNAGLVRVDKWVVSCKKMLQ
jgi:hypothetical protein